MAARRVASSSVNWSSLAERVPVRQREAFRTFKAKSDAYLNRIQQLPEELPKINFAHYKSRLTVPAMVDEFEKMYASVAVPYPKDSGNVMQQVDQEEKVAIEAKNTYVAGQKAKIKDNQTVINMLDSIPKPDQMTMQMFAYYFPNKALDPLKRPTFDPHDIDSQPDTTRMPWLNNWTERKNLMSHDDWEQMWWKKVEEQNKAKLAEAKRREAAQIEGKK